MVPIPLRRDGVKLDDLLRIRVLIQAVRGPSTTSPDAGADANQTQSPQAPPENEQVLDSTFRICRFGVHARVSDLAVFVQRLGEDRANSRGDSPVLFDQVNFLSAPGFSYGFNYYHRRHSLFRFLEPGFGVHFVILNWNDRPRTATAADVDVTQGTNLQVGVGGVASMFDGSVVVVSG